MTAVTDKVCNALQKWSRLVPAPLAFLLAGIVWNQHANGVKTEIRSQNLEARVAILVDEKNKLQAQNARLLEERKELEDANAGLLDTMRKLEEVANRLVLEGPATASKAAQELESEIERLVKENETLRQRSPGGVREEASFGGKTRAEFTEVARQSGGIEPRGDVAGRVVGLEHPERYKVVIYTQTDHWYAQPLAMDYITDIRDDGTWTNWVHLGKQYAVIVIDPSYRPPVATDVLPVVGGPVLAKATKSATGDGAP